MIYMIIMPPDIKAAEETAVPDNAKITAETVTYEGNKATAKGNAEITHKGTVIKADQIVYDYANRSILANGNVEVTQKNSKLYADQGFYNLESEAAELYNAHGYTSDIEQENKKIDGKLYFWGESIKKDSKSIIINKGIFTTCDCPKPQLHYHIYCDTAEIIPNDKIIARRSKLKLKQKTILNYNRMELSLKKGRQQQELFPKIGTNSNDGWYIKKGFVFDLMGSTAKGTLDWYQKTGFGGGLDYPYSFDDGKGWGRLTWYNLTPSANALVREDLTNNLSVQTIGKKEFFNHTHYNFTKNFYGGFSLGSYDYTYPKTGSSSWSNDSFYFGQSDRNQVYHYSQATTDYNTYSYNTKKFDYAHRLGDNWLIRTGGYYSGYAGNSPSNNSVWRYYSNMEYSNNYLDAVLAYKRTTNDSIYYLDRIPEISLSTKQLSLFNVPVKAAVSAGKYLENPTGLNMSRGSMYLGIEPSSYQLGDSGTFNIAGGVKQTFCDDGSGQYIISGETGFYQKVTNFAAVKANYFYQRPYGYSPFIDDFTPTYNNLAAGVEFFNGDKWKFSLVGGYDYHFDSKMSMIGVLEMKPSEKFNWTLGANYNIDSHNIPNVTSQLSWDLGNKIKLEHWALYDTLNNRFTYQDIGLSKETHDFFGKLIYRSQQKEIWLQFYLKAFPEAPVYINPSPERSIARPRGF